jgi:hypothetical protein
MSRHNRIITRYRCRYHIKFNATKKNNKKDLKLKYNCDADSKPEFQSTSAEAADIHFQSEKRAEFKHYTMSLHSNITCTYI